MASSSSTKLTLMGFGRAGAGKSQWGNWNARQGGYPELLKPGDANTPVTQEPTLVQITPTCFYIDTPGGCDVRGDNQIDNNLRASVGKAKEQQYVRAFVWVLRATERVLDTDCVYLKLFKETCGDDFWKNLVVVFTHCDISDTKLEQYKHKLNVGTPDDPSIRALASKALDVDLPQLPCYCFQLCPEEVFALVAETNAEAFRETTVMVHTHNMREREEFLNHVAQLDDYDTVEMRPDTQRVKEADVLGFADKEKTQFMSTIDTNTQPIIERVRQRATERQLETARTENLINNLTQQLTGAVTTKQFGMAEGERAALNEFARLAKQKIGRLNGTDNMLTEVTQAMKTATQVVQQHAPLMTQYNPDAHLKPKHNWNAWTPKTNTEFVRNNNEYSTVTDYKTEEYFEDETHDVATEERYIKDHQKICVKKRKWYGRPPKFETVPIWDTRIVMKPQTRQVKKTREVPNGSRQVITNTTPVYQTKRWYELRLPGSGAVVSTSPVCA